MTEVEEFLSSVLPRLRAADLALHNGNAGARAATWSHRDPVTLFGAVLTASGWTEIGPALEWLATRFSNLPIGQLQFCYLRSVQRSNARDRRVRV